MRIRGWRKTAVDRDAWKFILNRPGSCMNRTANGRGGVGVGVGGGGGEEEEVVVVVVVVV